MLAVVTWLIRAKPRRSAEPVQLRATVRPMSSELPPPPPPPGYGGVSGYPSGYPGYQGHPGYAPPAPAGYQPYTGRQYAGFWQRFLALFIDGLIATLFVVPALVALFAGP